MTTFNLSHAFSYLMCCVDDFVITRRNLSSARYISFIYMTFVINAEAHKNHKEKEGKMKKMSLC